jgi:hypothetical protein
VIIATIQKQTTQEGLLILQLVLGESLYAWSAAYRDLFDDGWLLVASPDAQIEGQAAAPRFLFVETLGHPICPIRLRFPSA